eukprot:364469-Chlamydomonas_euryale.AAC.18
MHVRANAVRGYKLQAVHADDVVATSGAAACCTGAERCGRDAQHLRQQPRQAFHALLPRHGALVDHACGCEGGWI